MHVFFAIPDSVVWWICRDIGVSSSPFLPLDVNQQTPAMVSLNCDLVVNLVEQGVLRNHPLTSANLHRIGGKKGWHCHICIGGLCQLHSFLFMPRSRNFRLSRLFKPKGTYSITYNYSLIGCRIHVPPMVQTDVVIFSEVWDLQMVKNLSRKTTAGFLGSQLLETNPSRKDSRRHWVWTNWKVTRGLIHSAVKDSNFKSSKQAYHRDLIMETENDAFQGIYLLFPFQGLFKKQKKHHLEEMQKSRNYYINIFKGICKHILNM